MRYLVGSETLPVDSGPFTPLMAVMTRRCTLSAHSARGIQDMFMEGRVLTTMDYTHLCGRQPSACSGEAGRQGHCRPLLPMARLLIQLGADATAAHSNPRLPAHHRGVSRRVGAVGPTRARCALIWQQASPRAAMRGAC